ncbi:protein BCCIP homolog [Aplysia californica]|uniref:Protein BCCIP homolog n=1 Tax=Aplysia californica TaxID=6500 RepID=A0ABM0JIG2_APLCA|nr:protein BCCIP homolog [Aplysia californica]
MCKMEGKHVEEENEINNSEEDYSEEEEIDENVGKVIDVAFDARPPSDSDFHGVKRLLQQLFVKHINDDLSELANVIIAQDFIGSVLKQDFGTGSDEDSDEESDDDDRDNVFAINTVVNISENQSLSCIEKINEFLTSKCEEAYKGEPGLMRKLLGDPSKQVGLLISERFINIPPQVALPSYESLKADIEKAVRKKKKFDFTHLVLISKTYRSKEGGAMGAEVFYSNPEEQLFCDMSEFNFTFSVAEQRDSISDGQWDDEGDMEALRTVMVFDASSLGHLIDKLRQEIPAK